MFFGYFDPENMYFFMIQIIIVQGALTGVSAKTEALTGAGQSCVKGQGKNTYGTGCFLLVHTGTEVVMSRHGLLTTVAYQLGPDAEATYALEGSIAIAGMAVSWLRDNLGLISSAAEIETLACQVESTGA